MGARGRPKLESARPELNKFRPELIRVATLTSPPAGADIVTEQKAPTAIALWNTDAVKNWFEQRSLNIAKSTVGNLLNRWNLVPQSRYRQMRSQTVADISTDHGSINTNWQAEHERFVRTARRQGAQVLWISSREVDPGLHQLFAHDLRGSAHWLLVQGPPQATQYQHFFSALQSAFAQPIALVLASSQLARSKPIGDWLTATNTALLFVGATIDNSHTLSQVTPTMKPMNFDPQPGATLPLQEPSPTLTHLQKLESESIHIMREVVAEAENPVMLYSVGKDSAVMLHLARKAFFPAPPPFPLLHVDTTWKFRAMYELRDSVAEKYGLELITHTNPEGLAQKVNPFTHGSSLHTDIMKTQALKQALDQHRFDFAFGGARRDEEKSRAKERVFSFRTAQHRWDAKNQRPELWQLYNTRKQRDESIRAFPLSNWTELDIWQYIYKEDIPIVPLYLAAERPVVERDGSLIMVDDDRMPLQQGEVPQMRSVRFRTLGCYPLTGAIESTAATLQDIIQEMLLAKTSERQGRMIDHDSAASMEKKKQEGYF